MKEPQMSPGRPLAIYIGHENEVIMQKLLEFTTDLGNQSAGFSSADDLRAKLAQTGRPADVVITSLEYIAGGNADGREFLQQMHERHPTVAVILINNDGLELTTSEATECGVRFFLREPIRLSEVEFYLARL